jgi:alpha-glucan,water dikinase
MGACAAVSVLAILACAEAASGMAMAGRRATLSLQPARIRSPLRLRGGAPAGRKVLDEACHTLESHKNNKKGTISLEVAKNADKSYECTITSTIPGPVWLHWGFASRGAGWKAPPDQYLPPDTKKIDDKAVQSPFKDNKIILKVADKDAPDALAFVVKCDEPEEWFNGPGGDFWMDFKPMDPNCIGKMIIQRETEATHWSILDRMRLVNENIKGVAESDDGLAWIYTILRFNVMKLVGISRRSNYQSKDLAHTQKTVTENIAAVYGRYPEARMWMRLMAATVPRGGGNGDAVRLEILDIMRRNGFKEGHRPGIEDHFIEQWHQKLHTNCAPDDLIIADAYIRFLETGNQDDYWSHLHGNGLSFEYMKNLGGGMGSARSGLDGMTASPGHYPHILNDIKHLKWTLMQLHGGQDLDFLVMKAAGGLDGETNALLNEIKDNRHEWWINGKITEARKKLAGYIDTPAGHRDALLVDVFLENWFKVQIDKADLGSMAQDDLINSVQLALENVALSYGEPFWGALRFAPHQ